jgi:hypothetical protein
VKKRKTDRVYLTTPRLEALLGLATIGASEVEAERDSLLGNGEFEPRDLNDFDRQRVEAIDAQLDLARIARKALAKRYQL